MKTNQELLDDVVELVKIRSVCERSVDEFPYGKGVNDALDYVLNLCKDFGFRTKKCGEMLGYAEIGQGEELVGILVHLDTVPEGSGWTYDPFLGERANGKLYGRGVIDDKGPAIASIYALKDLLDSELEIHKRFRIIFGTTEETGLWDDIAYYKQTEELPLYGFTPDGYFPCVNGEKGILQIQLTFFDSSGFVDISGGSAANVVPDSCQAQIDYEGLVFHVEKRGVSAHGSMPEKGVNAISKLMTSHKVIDTHLPFVEFYNRLFGMNIYGEECCSFEDGASGKLTMNIGKVEKVMQGIQMLIDIRYPVTCSFEKVLNAFNDAVSEYKCSFEVITHLPPVYRDSEDSLLQTLLGEYKKITHDDTKPLVIGGGTYARAMDNIVAFGPMFLHREETEHKADEHIYLNDLFALREIYRNTLMAINLKRGIL